MNKEKFKFPSRGFHIVSKKVGETDYFLEKLKSTQGYYDELSYILSAFSSAARSITFNRSCPHTLGSANGMFTIKNPFDLTHLQNTL